MRHAPYLAAILISPCLLMADLGTIEVEGVGEIIAEPDVLEWQIMVSTRGDSLPELKRRNDQASAEVYQILETMEIPKELVVSTGIRFSRGRRKDDARYYTENRISFALTDLDRYSELTEMLVGIDDVLIEDTEFRSSKYEQFAMQAMDMALDLARAKAGRIAQKNSLRIIALLELTEERARSRSITYGFGSSSSGDPQSRISVGKLRITKTVKVKYSVEELEPPTPPNADKPRG